MTATRPASVLRRPSAARVAPIVVALIMIVAAAQLVGGREARAGATTAGHVAPTVEAVNAPLTPDRFARRLSAEVYGYLPYWELDAGADAYLEYELLTDIALFSVGFDSSGTINTGATGYATVTGPRADTIIANAHAAGVRVDLTVTSFGFAKNAAFFSNPGAQATAISGILALVTAHGFDGVNVDVELLYNADFTAYGAFVGALRAALVAANPAGRVSVATNGSISGGGMALKALANGADRVLMMGYNYRTAGTSPAGSVAPLARSDGGKSLTTTLQLYASLGVPADRILMGLPYYGRTWPTVSGSLRAATTGSGSVFFPNEDIATIPPGTVLQYDALEQSVWFAVKNPSTGAWSQTYYDDPVSLRAKYAFAAQSGLAGVGIWALGYDRGQPGYWEAITASFGAIRLSGPDRYSTAAAISANVFPAGPGTVYIATGRAFPDALAAAAAAGQTGSPVLLVQPTALPPATAAELSRLRPGQIIVLGGTGAVSDTVLAELAPYTTGAVTRIGGTDRYDTAARLAGASFPGGAPVVYIASGLNFPDGLAAAPAAARDRGPVLLTDPLNLSPATSAELVRLAPGRVVVIGGPGAVSDAALGAIQAILPAAQITRLAGPDRYATAAAVSATFSPGTGAVFLATGLDFPDALAGAAAAGTLGSPILLTGPAVLPPSVVTELSRLRPHRAVIMSGPAVISEAVLVATRTILAQR